MNFKALSKTAPLHIIPCYSMMFTDLLSKPRNFQFLQRNPLPISPSENQFTTVLLCHRGINTNLFTFNPVVHCDEVFQAEVLRSQSKPTRSVKCQTKFRETSAQTESWLPDAKLRDGEKCVPEILFVNCYAEPDLHEIEAIERARARRDWEKFLPNVVGKDMKSRTAQLEAFEWKNIIARELELNESQMDRMKQVSQMIEQRQENNIRFANAMLENVQRRNAIEKDETRNKQKNLLQRKLRKLLKQKCGNVSELQEPVHNLWKLNDKSGWKLDYQVSMVSAVGLKPSMNLKKVLISQSKLWKPKESTKEAAHGFLQEKNLRSLFESVKKLNNEKKAKGLQCRTKRVFLKQNDVSNVAGLDDNEDELIQNHILVQKSIRGCAMKSILDNGTRESFEKIQEYRKKFPIDCVQQILPEQYFDLNPEIEPHKNETDHEENLVELMKPLVADILQQGDEMIAAKKNKKTLQIAETERSIRREEARQNELGQQMAELRSTEIQRLIDESHQKIAEKLLDEILPSVVEIVADSDARGYVKKLSTDVDQEAWSTSLTDSEIVHELLSQFSIPKVVKSVENQLKFDCSLTVRIAVHDAFELHLKDLPLDETKIICEAIVDNLLNKIKDT